MDYVKASMRTIKGLVESSWEKNNGLTTLKVSIPANTTAVVYLPAPDPSGVTESSVEAGKAAGVHYLRKERNAVVYEIASGQYEFTFPDAK